MLEDALEHLVRGIVDHPDDVVVKVKNNRSTTDSRGGGRYKGGKTFQVIVNAEDLGRVIGRNGRTANALRTVLIALNQGRNLRIDFVDVNDN
ncbi:MAG: KH domain-containing protein [Candidatus Nanopelagicales bacterium]|jgi:predicted RNA-binding protein YlqC (UPF0109 family)